MILDKTLMDYLRWSVAEQKSKKNGSMFLSIEYREVEDNRRIIETGSRYVSFSIESN